MPPHLPGRAASPNRGRSLVVGLVLLGLAGAAAGITYQRFQTHRCLGFYGPEVARLVNTAPRVELLRLAPGGGVGRLVARESRDVTTAKGLVHLRRGLVEDANFDWRPAADGGRLPDDAWDLAFVFSDPEVPGARATIVIDLDDGGTLAVVGQPGRVRMGRLASGLRKWIAGL